MFLTQELNQGLLHCRRILYQLSYQGSPLSTCSQFSAFILLSENTSPWTSGIPAQSDPLGKDTYSQVFPVTYSLTWTNL